MPKPATLTKTQQKKLKALAHDLSPLVMIGREGVSDGVIAAAKVALEDHELIKVRVLESSALDRKGVGDELAQRLDAHHVATIGRMVILYSRHPTHPTIPI